jgi:hypothetical protein
VASTVHSLNSNTGHQAGAPPDAGVARERSSARRYCSRRTCVDQEVEANHAEAMPDDDLAQLDPSERIREPLEREAILSDFTFVYETQEERDRRLEPDFAYFDSDYKAIIDLLPQGVEQVRQLPDRPPHTGSEVIGIGLGIWTVLGLPSLLELGKRIRSWMRGKKGRSGNAQALRAVALDHLREQVPAAHPNLATIQILDPYEPDRYPVDYKAVYLYRIYDDSGDQVYVLEIDAAGTLVQFTQRSAALFESG